METSNDKTQIASMLKVMQIIHIALMAGVVLFLVIVSTLLTDPSAPKNQEIFDNFKWIVVALGGGALFMGGFIGKMLLANAEGQILTKKLAAYQTSLIAQVAIYEMAALFSIVATLLSNAHILFSVASVMLVMMYLQRPTKERIATRLNLTEEEKELFC